MAKQKVVEKPKKTVSKGKPKEGKPKKDIHGINVQHERMRLLRWPIVIELKQYSGKTYREIAQIVKERLGLKEAPDHKTILNDWNAITAEWKAERISDVEAIKEHELKCIQNNIEIAYNAWIKTLTDNELKQEKKKGSLGVDGKVSTKDVERIVKENINYGNPSYLAEIRANEIERRKILGVYSAVKQDVNVSQVRIIELPNNGRNN